MCAFNMNIGRMRRWYVSGWCLVKDYSLLLITFPQKTFNCSCASMSCNQQKLISHYFHSFLRMKRVEQPLEVELYVFKGVLGWRWSSSIKAVQIGKIWWTFTKSSPVSEYAEDPTTCRKVLHFVRIGLLGLTSEELVGLVVLSLKYYFPVIQLRAPGMTK